jgi:BON domain
MKPSFLFIAALPVSLVTGCISHHDLGYTTPAAVVAPTSPSPAVRVYPDRPTPRITTAPGEADDLTIANSVRNILARDTAHIYGNVDVGINRGVVTLRGAVPTEHDRLQLYDQIGSVPGVVSVDNQLGVDLR